MGARLRSWCQQIKKHRVAIGVVAIVLVVVITLIIAGYWFDWTGFNGYNKVTVTHTISGTNAGTVTRTEEYQPGKALWDWLQLLIIPAVLAVAGYVINLTISRGEQAATEQRANSEREIAQDNQREGALQAYIDKMSEFLREKQLDDPMMQIIARARTLIVLRRLDPVRKGSVLQFLQESSLIERGNPVIDLSFGGSDYAGLRVADLRWANLRVADLHSTDLKSTNLQNADLYQADLSYADLDGADLSGANLCEAILRDAYLAEAWLRGADLSGANLLEAILDRADLSGAKITQEQLKEAKSLQGATMPDGSIHP